MFRLFVHYDSDPSSVSTVIQSLWSRRPSLIPTLLHFVSKSNSTSDLGYSSRRGQRWIPFTDPIFLCELPRWCSLIKSSCQSSPIPHLSNLSSVRQEKKRTLVDFDLLKLCVFTQAMELIKNNVAIFFDRCDKVTISFFGNKRWQTSCLGTKKGLTMMGALKRTTRTFLQAGDFMNEKLRLRFNVRICGEEMGEKTP